MRVTSVFRFLLRILGPALLGVGTIFQAKARASDHWSTSPRVVISVDASSDHSADPATDEDVEERSPTGSFDEGANTLAISA